jgi:hypothetical protein
MSTFSETDLNVAVVKLSMLKYFPADPLTQSAVMDLLRDMCPSREALDWLVSTMVNRIGEWKGPAELRGVMCWRFRPADGIEAESSSRGFRSEDGEAIEAQQHEQLKAGSCPAIESQKALRQVTGGTVWPK